MEKRSWAERREFLRYPFDKPISYRVISSSGVQSPVSRVLDAVARNLSASGVLFTSTFLPEISSIVVLDMDYQATRLCREVEENALIVKDKVIGKVVRIEYGCDGAYGVGVAFIKRLSDLPKNIENLIV